MPHRASSTQRWRLALSALAMMATLAMAPACSSSRRAPVESRGPEAERAFYFWRTVLQLGEEERRALAELKVSRLYLRMFDIAWEQERAQLVGKVSLGPGETLPVGDGGAALEIVPVVFVREEVLRRLSEEARVALAAELWGEVAARAAAMGFAPRELQLDCDWTDSTREPFFAMLRELRRLSGLPLSATIRLHQVKYRERTGVPPVERGMLMFYNMGSFSAEPGSRAIFDPDSASRYVSRVGEYPLPLDAALPIWSWTLHVRDGRVINVLQSTDPAELAESQVLRRKDASGEARYVSTASAFFHGVMLREGDELVGEITGPEETAAAARLLAPHLAPIGAAGAAGAAGAKGDTARMQRRTIALFDLSERNLSRHGATSLERLFASIR